MSEPDNFLSRWSRRKREAERESSDAAQRDSAVRSDRQPSHVQPSHEQAQSVRRRESADPVPGNQPVETAALDSRVRGKDLASTGSDSGDAAQKSEFDLSTLPPIESITSATDIRAFLQKGVPAELSRAALRRAWSADPAIRDFIGIAENQYDFATGSDIPGFGSLDMSADEVRKLVAEVFGEVPAASPEAPAAIEKAPQTGPSQQASDSGPSPQQDDVAAANQVQNVSGERPPADTESIVQRDKVYTAAQQNSADPEYDPPPPRRSHGRAIPQ